MNTYLALEWNPTDNTAVKLSTGEPPASNYLRPELIQDVVQYVDGTIVECNTAYGGSRSSTAMHYQVAEDHGFTEIADFQILDENGSMTLPVEGGYVLTENYVGSAFAHYDSYLVLSHFKGHAMAGYGGAIKNISIGFASSEGKSWIHSGGKSLTNPWGGQQDAFLESMAEAGKSVSDYLDKGNNIDKIIVNIGFIIFGFDLLNKYFTMNRMLDQSIKNLGMDYIDLYIWHMWDYNTPLYDIMEGLNNVIRAGKIRKIGISNCYAYQLAKANALAEREGFAKFVSFQEHYNLIFREEECEMAALCHENNIAMTPYSPLASGNLSKHPNETSKQLRKDSYAKFKYDATKEQDEIIICQVQEIAENKGVIMTEVALAWLLIKVTSPLREQLNCIILKMPQGWWS